MCRAVSGPAARFVAAQPTIPPTHAFTTTSSVNCAQLAASPSRTTGEIFGLAAAFLKLAAARPHQPEASMLMPHGESHSLGRLSRDT